MNTTLRAYLDELKLLLEQEALEEVMGHCRHILQHFPKNVETYRLFGRALLEKTRYSEAADMFQRVLSALPDDFVSHLAMSAVAEEEGQLPAAIWHLERAYELEANNSAVRDEIKRLMERRDGSAPDRIEMTRGGLAHIYARSRLYDQARAELEAALSQMPERVDLQLLLAEVLWESDHAVDAANVALRALEKSPNSIDANRIMASLWLKAGRPSDAAPFVARLEQLDPFVAWATVHPDRKPVPRDAFQLPRLDWDSRAARALTTDVPDWVSSIENVFDAPLVGPASTSSEPLSDQAAAWLNGSPAASGAADIPVEVPDWFSGADTATSAPAAAMPADDDVPDWFKTDAAVSPATQPASSAPAANALPDIPDWLDDESAAPAAQSATAASVPSGASGAPEIPSWLDDELSSTSGENAPTASSSQPAADIPSWLDEAPAAPAASSTASTSAASGAPEIPSWLDEEPTAESPEPSTADEVSTQPLDAMSWLATGPLPPLEEVAKPEPVAPASNIPDWLSDSAPANELPDLETITSDTPAQPDADLDWMSDTAQPAASTSPLSAEAEPATSAASDLDWLSGGTSADDLFGSATTSADESAAPASAEAEPAASAASDLDWLSGVSASDVKDSPQTTANAETASDWLSGASSSEDLFADLPITSGESQTKPEPTVSSGAVSDWLSGASSSDDLFASLGASTDEPTAEAEPTASPATSADWLSGTSSSDDLFASLDMSADEPMEDASPAASTASDSGDWFGAASRDLTLDSTGDLDSEEQPEGIAPGEAPSWLAQIAPPTGAAQPLDSLDFSKLDSSASTETPAESLDFSSLDTPPSIPTPADSLDFSSLNIPAGSDNADWTAPASDAKADDWLADFGSTPAELTPDTASPEPASAPADSFEVRAPTAMTKRDWETDSTPAAPTDSGVELEEDWLASFELTPNPDDASQRLMSTESAGTNISDSVPEPTSSADDWLAGFTTPSAEPEAEAPEPAAAESSDWLGSLVSTPGSAAPVQAAAPTDDWLGSLGGVTSQPVEDKAAPEPEPDDDLPEWMRGVPSVVIDDNASAVQDAEPEGKTGLTGMLSNLGKANQQARPVNETGILDPGTVPDWLTAVGSNEPSTAESSAEVLANAATAPDMSSGSDWLSNMPLPSSRAAADVPDTASANEELAPGETPDWLTNIVPGAKSTAKPVEALPLDSLDFSSIVGKPAAEAAPASESGASDLDWLNNYDPSVSPASADSAPTPADRSFDRVAQPANLVNTNAQSSAQSFTFDSKPAWMRKKKSSGAKPAPAQDDDLPDWMKE